MSSFYSTVYWNTESKITKVLFHSLLGLNSHYSYQCKNTKSSYNLTIDHIFVYFWFCDHPYILSSFHTFILSSFHPLILSYIKHTYCTWESACVCAEYELERSLTHVKLTRSKYAPDTAV